ncbi:oligosaccharide flippase family protein [Rhabdochromatium marinum]|uniref:oligosaccharide flippase family protein n=1 Tax=Rhabdochromatium marinum TaxID=48729 RepID=UPI0019074C8A|nr:hypothetical protein [Rhabdochromatium marinum]
MKAQDLGLKGLARNIGATFSRQIGASLLGLATTVIIARLYGPEGNGAFTIALLLPSMLATFLNLGVAPANVYHLGSEQITVRQILSANLRIFSLFSVLGIAIGAALLLWKRERFFPGIDPRILWLALATFPISLLNNYLLSVFQGLQRFRPYNILAIVQPGALLVFVIALIILGNRDLALLVGAQFFAQSLTLILTVRWLIPLLGSKDMPPLKSCVKKTLSYGWKAHLSNILAFINYKIDLFLTNIFLGPAAAGIYVIAVALVERLWMISQAVSAVLLPRLSQLVTDEDKRRRLTPLVTRWVLTATLIGAVFVAIFSDLLITWLFGRDYSDALLPVWILLPGIVMTSASRILANDIAARGRPELNMYTSVLVVVVNVVGNLILIPHYGLPGAAAATTIAYTLNLLLRLIIYSNFTENCFSDSLVIKFSDVRLLWSAIHK